MGTFPFELLIQRASSDEPAEPLLCKGHLRVIPGSREVYDAAWRGRNVVAKVFSRRIGAGRRSKREWRGLCQLQSRGVNTPEPLFYGRTQDGRLAVVVEKMVDSPTVMDVFNGTREKAVRMDLLLRVCRELAMHHERGVLQKDLHLGNFLLAAERVLVLDPGQMRFFSHPVTRKRSISQLALLSCYLPADDVGSISRLCKEYFSARRWRFDESDSAVFQKEVESHIRRMIRRQLRKCVRTNKRHLRIRTHGLAAVFERAFYAGAEPLDFVEQIDELMAHGEIFKDSNTTYISRFTWNGRDIVVKRYNHKGLVHSLRHTIEGSRARRCWLNGHRLMALNIPTPRPVVFIEERKGVFLWKSYLITEFVDGPNLRTFLRNANIAEQRKSTIRDQVMKQFETLRKYRISHGDTKHTNILVTNNGPVLTDLDGMKAHRWTWLFRIKRAKDLTRIAQDKKSDK
jgi:tRNA A-37 threonylcarbamoyl transferase component Bud32